MAGKGRIRVGADADITIFDPETVADRATCAEPTLPSAGIHNVLVKGTPVVSDGEIVEGPAAKEAVPDDGFEALDPRVATRVRGANCRTSLSGT